jgi:hypothetical protein
MRQEPRQLNPWKIANRLWSAVPTGGSLPEEVWHGRHRNAIKFTDKGHVTVSARLTESSKQRERS